MTHGDSLALTVEATQRSIEGRLKSAMVPHHLARARDRYAAIDTFMAATSRHMAAVESVLVGQVVLSVPESGTLVHGYIDAARRLELSLALLKARLYGEAHAVQIGWAELWGTVVDRLTEHNTLELSMVDGLIRYGDPVGVDGLARRLFEAERRAPTRPHPHLPHTGLLSPMARRIWAAADRFWDQAEGRVIPEPVHPAPHKHDSLLAQYLVADPRFDARAHVMDHHHHLPHRH